MRDEKGRFIEGHKSLSKRGKRPDFHGNSGSFKKGISVSPKTQFRKGIVPKNKGKGRTTVCLTCGSVFPNRAGNRKYCSTKCMWESREYREKHQKALVGRAMPKGIPHLNARGEKNHRWTGGKGRTERQAAMGKIEYKLWRSSIFERDNWTCQTCQARGGVLEAHHIKSWKHFPELRYEASNGVTLCKSCHALTKQGRR